jgi:hypothetical protein
MRRILFFLSACLLAFHTGAALAQDEAGDLLGRINGLRASLGRAGYALNGSLAAAAQSQAAWIVESGSVSHTRPDGSGPRTRAANAGYPSQQVSENIYGGTNADVNDAWTFWVNSGVHYNSIVNANYTEIGIGIARGSWGAAYVLVFGNPTGAWSAPAAVGNSNAGGGNTGGGNAAANNAPPSFVLGLDENGNIMHEVQPGDTLGDIALIYGYTWDDLPRLMQLNQISNVRDLVVGSVFLVPSKMEGVGVGAANAEPDPDAPTPEPTATYTPLPATITPFIASGGNPSIPTPIPTLDPTYEMQPPTLAFIPATISALDSFPTLDPTYEMQPETPAAITPPITPPITPTATDAAAALPPIPTINPTQIAALPTVEGTSAAFLPTPAPVNSTPMPNSNALPTWIVIALAVQVLIVVGAGIEFGRRALLGRKNMGNMPRGDYFEGRKRR